MKNFMKWNATRLSLVVSLLIFSSLSSAPQAASLLREVWNNIGGVSIGDLTSDARYPNTPDATNYVTDFFESPSDIAENYGQRMHGYIIPPATGNYTFWIATDDAGELWLSTDEGPANAQRIAYVASWTAAREWTKEPNQQSAPIRLEKDRAYYISALQKEGGGGDNLAVRWLRPDGVDEGPIPATYLYPWGTAFTPPKITAQPTNTTVIEGQMATFTVRTDPLSPGTAQWRKNGVNIPGATSSTLDFGPVTMADNQARFMAVLTNRLGSTNSAEAILTVTADTVRPTLVAAMNVGSRTTVRVTFSEAVDSTTGTNPGNYTINNGISVNSVAMEPGNQSVLLTISPLSFGTSYTVTVSNVRDRAQSPNTILANSTISFIATEYAPVEIGAAFNGSTATVAGGFDLTSRSGELGGTTDEFHFGYQQLTGDFDFRVRLARAEITDAFMQAGLMARASLTGNSPFAGVFSSSPQLGCFFESRASAGAAASVAAPTGGYPVNYPQMWLRLRRSGNAFTGYASFDGSNWTQLGTSTITLPTTVYFGMALSSSNPSRSSSVQFRDLGTASGAATVPGPEMEKHGPTSRRTGLVLNEIMYHPKARADLKDLEFIEIYNAGAIFEDMSGFSLTGEIDYTFPAGTILPAGGFLLVAKVPADVQTVYGVSGVLGPWTGSLNNNSGLVTLRNEMGSIMQEVEYKSSYPWPASADGAGNSLVINRPSYGEADVRAWAASSVIGGSPGNVDPVMVHPLSNILINEFLAHTDPPLEDFIELYNHSNVEVDLSGCWLSDDRDTNKFRIPDNTRIPARGHVAFSQTELGFALDASGETIFLVNPSQTRVLDSIRFNDQENGVSSGRWPDGAGQIRRLAEITDGTRNSSWRASEVVINEIMYAPISGDPDEEYVELHNPGAQSINLEGWRLQGGIDFQFPANATIPAGGYAVVGRNAVRLLANYTQLNTGNTFGDYQGSLGNGGERIALAKPDTILSTNEFEQVISTTIHIVVNEVTYSDGGRWGEWSDEGGSSLELIDPRSDNSQPANWADSDETAKAPWTTVQVTGVLDHGFDGFAPDALQLSLQGAGEALVDDIEVIQGATGNRLANPGFENGNTGWTIVGNHSGSSVVTLGAASGTRALHVRGLGRGDTGPNLISSQLTSALTTGQSGTIRAKVRWLKGWPEILLRFRGSWLECGGAMQLPTNLGTPGLVNSRKVSNAGPAVYDVTHWPVLPQTGQSVVVTARASDPSGVTSLSLRYRSDPNGTLQTLTMRDDGFSGDAVSGDGLYSVTIPGNAGTTVAFRVEAADSASTIGRFPFDAPTRECLIRWGQPVPFGTFGTYVLLTTSATASQWSSGGALNNTYRNMTFVYSNGRVIYNGGVKDKGSPWHGGAGDYFMVTPSDEPFLGSTDLALCSTGNAGDEATQQREQIAFWIGREMGGHYLNRRYVHVYINGNKHRTISEDSEEPNGEYARSRVPQRSDGDLYKIEDWFEYGSTGNRGNRDATLEPFTTTGGVYKTARYRWAWRKRAIDGSANNFTNLFNLVTAVNSSPATYVPQVHQQVNVRNWMRVFALQRIVGNWDSYGFSRGKNGYIYKGEGIQWEMFPWDIDFVLGSGSNGATDGLWGANDPTINRMYDTPEFKRILWQAYLEAVEGPMLPENYNPPMDERYRILRANGITASAPQPVKDYINARRNHIISQMNAANTTTFAITSNSGNNFTTNKSVVKIAGTAPFAVFAIRVNGILYPVSWTTERNWEITVPLMSASNVLAFTGIDRFGQPISGFSDTITVNYTGVVLRAEDWVAINEIMYNSAEPGASFIELFNRHTTTPFDLSNFILNGVGYTFPEGSIIQPNSYLILAKDAAGFSAAFGASVLVHGEFPGSLDNGGERIELIRPGATPAQDTIIDQVRYDDDLPWPPLADGFGPSLQLIDAAQDNWRVANWSTTTTSNAVNRATPGTANSIRNTLAAFPEVWINEVQANNLSTADRMGDRDPWIELFNSGSTTVDLSGLYLSDNYTNLTQWQFPAGTLLAAGQFLVVWVDGEPAESTSTELHTSFRLPSSTGSIALSRIQLSQPAVIDYLNYNLLGAGRSFGSIPDGRGVNRRPFDFPTPGAANNPASKPITVVINEWMAGNTRTLADIADNQFEDWIELYNAGTESVDLSYYTLTDALTNITKYAIPAGTILAPGGYLLIWADEETTQNGRNADLHANFKLSLTGEEIGLFAPDGAVIDSLAFGPQSNDISEGRAADAAEPPFIFFTVPTPRAANVSGSGNQPPTIGTLSDQAGDENTQIRFTATATDPDAGQLLTFSLVGVIPAGAAIEPASGVFTWTPTEAQGPGSFPITIRVVDNGTPARSASKQIIVTVNEVNRAPTLAAVPNQVINEGSLLAVQLVGSDLDLPANALVYSVQNAPTGVALNPSTGELTWTPSEQQGAGDYTISVRVTDNGVPSGTALLSFDAHVNEVNNAPVFTQVEPRTVNEGATVSIQLEAVDLDTPAAAIRYSLVSGPAGATINQDTGLISWITSEATGPTTGIFVVRATENNAEQLSASQSFSVTVQEVNQAPSLADITDIFVNEGETVSFTASATDADQPAQTLTFQLQAGAPAGAQINANTGEFTWAVPDDSGASTNQITITVVDNGPGNLTASKTFRIIVSPLLRVVINEIMHSPAAANAAYVELRNSSTRTAHDLSGWQLNGKDLRFTFPAGTVLQPGGYLCVTKNRAAFNTAYGSALPVAGEWTNDLRTSGETLTLLQPQAGGTPLVVDKVTFTATAPWPAAVNGTGAALQLVDARQDNNRLANWEALASYNGPTNLIVMTNTWRYHQAGQDLGSTWTAAAYSDSSWSTGRALLYVEDAALPAPKNTALTIGPSTFYFRTKFTLPVKPIGAQLRLETIIDDGAVYYLNGKELTRQRMPLTGPVAYADFATDVVNNAVLEGPLMFSADDLVAGENVFAVEVHQVNAGSSDIVFGCSLDLVGGTVVSRTPGAANSVTAVLPPFAPLYINEILPENTAGARDGAGDRDPWIEIHNSGSEDINLTGYYLTENYSILNRWPFPAGSTIRAGQFMVVWLDGETAETTATEYHASFRAGLSGGVALVRAQNNKQAIIDYANYSNLGANVAFGSLPDGQLDDRRSLAIPTPGAPNEGSTPNRPPVINNIAAQTADEGQLLSFTVQGSDPDSGQTLAFSLVNAPAGATIQQGTGAFSWVPSETQGPGEFNVTVVATDNGNPALAATNQFSVTVREVNSVPSMTAIAPQSATEHTEWTLTLGASDTDLPAQSLAYTLVSAPPGLTVTPAGLLRWTPTEGDGGNTAQVTVKVTDNGTPALSDTKQFGITVLEGNFRPSLGLLSDRSVEAGEVVTFTATATDADLPAQALTFSVTGAPAGATINPTTGVFTWTPTAAQAGSSYPLTVTVADSFSPAKSDQQTITITVTAPQQDIEITLTRAADGRLIMTWPTSNGRAYTVQHSATLLPGSWQFLSSITGDGSPASFTELPNGGPRFYRVLAE